MVLVTGATGHLGNNLVRELLAKGERVRVLLRHNSDLKPLSGLDVEIVEGDILNRSSLLKAFIDIEVVYHLAALVWILPGNEELINRVNLEGTKNVIDACLETKVKRLVYVSSIHALEEPSYEIKMDESLPFDPKNSRGEYDRSKAKASLAVLDAVKTRGLDAVIICPTGITGPGDYKLSLFGESLADYVQGKLKFFVDGAYNYVDVRDVAKGLVLSASKGKNGEVYIFSGEKITLKEVYMYVNKVIKVERKAYRFPYFFANIFAGFLTKLHKFIKLKPYFTSYALRTIRSNSNISHEKATRELGFIPRSLKISIYDHLIWLKEQGIINF